MCPVNYRTRAKRLTSVENHNWLLNTRTEYASARRRLGYFGYTPVVLQDSNKAYQTSSISCEYLDETVQKRTSLGSFRTGYVDGTKPSKAGCSSSTMPMTLVSSWSLLPPREVHNFIIND